MASQIPLPLQPDPNLDREDFIVSLGNAPAFALVETWPWTVSAAALHGPSGSGKTHLVEIWKIRSGAQAVAAAALSGSAYAQLDRGRPIAIEDVDASIPNPARDAALFHLLESATMHAPLLLTGRELPSTWQATLPDLHSRFQALVSFPLWAPDDVLLEKLVQKLFDDRQLTVPAAVVQHMIRSLERSPAAIRDFVERADELALSRKKPISLALIREILPEQAR